MRSDRSEATLSLTSLLGRGGGQQEVSRRSWSSSSPQLVADVHPRLLQQGAAEEAPRDAGPRRPRRQQLLPEAAALHHVRTQTLGGVHHQLQHALHSRGGGVSSAAGGPGPVDSGLLTCSCSSTTRATWPAMDSSWAWMAAPAPPPLLRWNRLGSSCGDDQVDKVHLELGNSL